MAKRKVNGWMDEREFNKGELPFQIYRYKGLPVSQHIPVVVIPTLDYEARLFEAAKMLAKAFRDCELCLCATKCDWKEIQGGAMCIKRLLRKLNSITATGGH